MLRREARIRTKALGSNQDSEHVADVPEAAALR